MPPAAGLGFPIGLPDIEDAKAMAKTLLELAGADLAPAKTRDACLILIDLQNEYVSGPIAVVDVDGAIRNTTKLLRQARENGAPVFHIAHKGRPGSLFDRNDQRGQIVTPLAPLPNEPVVEKTLPNAFNTPARTLGVFRGDEPDCEIGHFARKVR